MKLQKNWGHNAFILTIHGFVFSFVPNSYENIVKGRGHHAFSFYPSHVTCYETWDQRLVLQV